MADKVRVYSRRIRGGKVRWYLQLSWRGKIYRRFMYDEAVPFYNREMAERIKGQIDAAIEASMKHGGKRFDPEHWFRSPSELQFDTLAAQWWAKHGPTYAPSGKTNMKRYTDLAIEHFKGVNVTQITAPDIQGYAESLPGSWAPKTTKTCLGTLHKCMTDLARQGYLDTVPIFPQITVPKKEVKWISREWQEKIIEAIPERDRPIFIFMRTWGVRPGEARALMWDCVDFDREIITIRRTFSGIELKESTKTDRNRQLPITGELRESLNKLRGIGGFVYRNRQGRPYGHNISEIWNAARDKVKASKVKLVEGTRKSWATQNQDKPAELVKAVLGHASILTTEKHYMGVDLAKIREVWG